MLMVEDGMMMTEFVVQPIHHCCPLPFPLLTLITFARLKKWVGAHPAAAG
jgi:hypothetical protein